MRIITSNNPRIAEYLLVTFALFSLWASSVSFWNGEYFWSHNPNYTDPLARYNADSGIRLFNTIAFLIDILFILIVLAWSLRISYLKGLVKILPLIAVIAASLTWLELWYGSTFYYGEVRDKQGLLFSVNHGGVLGSFLFLTYVIWRIDWVPDDRRKRVWISGFLTILLIFVQAFALRQVEEYWKLWQS